MGMESSKNPQLAAPLATFTPRGVIVATQSKIARARTHPLETRGMMQEVTSTVVTPNVARASAARPSARSPARAIHDDNSGCAFSSAASRFIHPSRSQQRRRGSTVAAHAKKSGKKSGKKAAAEPEPENEPTPVDDNDENAEGAEIVDADDAEGEAREVGDASELLPEAAYEGEEVEEAEASAGAFGTALGTVKDSLANPAVKNLGILGLSVLAGSFALSCYKVYMKVGDYKTPRPRVHDVRDREGIYFYEG